MLVFSGLIRLYDNLYDKPEPAERFAEAFVVLLDSVLDHLRAMAD